MKRLLLTIILIAAVSVASGACCGTATAADRPNTKAVKTAKQKHASAYKPCTGSRCAIPKRKHAKR